MTLEESLAERERQVQAIVDYSGRQIMQAKKQLKAAKQLTDVLEVSEPRIKEIADEATRQGQAAARLQKAAKALLKFCEQGNLRDMAKQTALTNDRIREADAEIDEIAPMDFDTESYLRPDGAFFSELEDAAREAGLSIFVRGATVYCYPVLLQTEPQKLAVKIDKKSEYSIRPSHLVSRLLPLQQREPKVNAGAILKRLRRAYPFVWSKSGGRDGQDVKLTDIYALLTLLDGVDRDYTRLDFARDLYFLDVSGLDRIDGQRAVFSASTSSREDQQSLIRFVDRAGHERIYSRIRFVADSRDSTADEVDSVTGEPAP